MVLLCVLDRLPSSPGLSPSPSPTQTRKRLEREEIPREQHGCIRAPTWTSQAFFRSQTFPLASPVSEHLYVCWFVSTGIKYLPPPGWRSHLGTMPAETIRDSASQPERTLRSHKSPTYCGAAVLVSSIARLIPTPSTEAQPSRFLSRFHSPRPSRRGRSLSPVAHNDCDLNRDVAAAPSYPLRVLLCTGNIDVDDAGVCKVHLEDRMVRLIGPHSIIGRSIIVTAGEDDLGRVSSLLLMLVALAVGGVCLAACSACAVSHEKRLLYVGLSVFSQVGVYRNADGFTSVTVSCP